MRSLGLSLKCNAKLCTSGAALHCSTEFRAITRLLLGSYSLITWMTVRHSAFSVGVALGGIRALCCRLIGALRAVFLEILIWLRFFPTGPLFDILAGVVVLKVRAFR